MTGKRVQRKSGDLREKCATTGAPKYVVQQFGPEHLDETGSLRRSYRPDCDLFGWAAIAEHDGRSEKQIRNDLWNLAKCPRYAEVRSVHHIYLERPNDMCERDFLIPMTHTNSWDAGRKQLDAHKGQNKPHWGRSTVTSAGDLTSSPSEKR
jgi:hypothetical protein